MRQSLARFSGSVSSIHAASLVDFITATSESRFSVHTGQTTEDYYLLFLSELPPRRASFIGPLDAVTGAITKGKEMAPAHAGELRPI
jgi:hypothetical protein